MKLPVTIYQDEEGWYVAECLAIPGCVSQGKTLEEALANIREAVQLCLEVRKEKGLPLTVQTFEIEMPAYA
ncbi:MAG: type II toxin-antitoxin system HicB family antitoxin [Chloroflexi bacterium]|nr:type II toxin-antitoxin system HicB family antitoxin [Chloroflexota bacterium]